MNIFKRIGRWFVREQLSERLWCNESDYSDVEWANMRRKFFANGGTDHEWKILIEERTREQ